MSLYADTLTVPHPLDPRALEPRLLDHVQLDPPTAASRIYLAHAARRLAYRPNDWRHAVRFSPTERTYTRIPLPRENGFEAWLLTWLPGQGTTLHDHAGSSGAFIVIDGQLTEETAEQDLDGHTTLRERVLHDGDVRPFGRDHVHRVQNLGTEPAVSIHVYSPTLSAMTQYDLERGLLVTTARRRAGVDW
jgi:predicted metal-dependent enzyme (double-stranded beta helix superfamily)